MKSQKILQTYLDVKDPLPTESIRYETSQWKSYYSSSLGSCETKIFLWHYCIEICRKGHLYQYGHTYGALCSTTNRTLVKAVWNPCKYLIFLVSLQKSDQQSILTKKSAFFGLCSNIIQKCDHTDLNFRKESSFITSIKSAVQYKKFEMCTWWLSAVGFNYKLGYKPCHLL